MGRRVRRRSYSFETYTETNKKKNIVVSTFKWLGSIVLVIFLAFLTVKFGGQTLTVRGESLEPTYYDNDVVLVNKLLYKVSDPKRYDMIAFSSGEGGTGHYSIKRIVGVPGDSVRIADGVLYINGKPAEHLPESMEILNPGLAKEEILLGEEEYFVMGDNYNNSEDSRIISVGNVKREKIIGKVQGKLYQKKG